VNNPEKIFRMALLMTWPIAVMAIVLQSYQELSRLNGSETRHRQLALSHAKNIFFDFKGGDPQAYRGKLQQFFATSAVVRIEAVDQSRPVPTTRNANVIVNGDKNHRAVVSWNQAAATSQRLSVIRSAILTSIGALLIWGLGMILIRRYYIAPLLKQALDQQRHAAIAMTVQMLAHDIRKPFSIMKILIKKLSTPHMTLSEMQQTVATGSIEFNRVSSAVESMIEDIMGASESCEKNPDDYDLEESISRVLRSVFHSRTNSDVSFQYRFRHQRTFDLDQKRLERILTNLIGNGADAVPSGGTIWIDSREMEQDHNSFIQITVGNSGSFISKEDQKTIFEPFKTKGKKNGTGLGLSIVEKIVTSVGGRVWIHSTLDFGTEFHFTIPVRGTTLSTHKAEFSLPRHSRELSPDSLVPVFQVAEALQDLPLIALVEDDPFLAESWQSMVQDAKIDWFTKPEDLFAKIDSDQTYLASCSVVVTDMNFDNGSTFNGLDVAQRTNKSVPVILSTEVPPRDKKIDSLICSVIDKMPRSWEELSHLVSPVDQESA
jgi:signal transduction histidine kinase